jgi:hypothetical protein
LLIFDDEQVHGGFECGGHRISMISTSAS